MANALTKEQWLKHLRELWIEALEQPAQEPVTLIKHENGNYSPKHQWQGLTDKEIQKILSKISDDMYPWKDGMLGHLIARAIEAKLKEKNTVTER